MISIDNLIYNTLLTGEKVYLPKVGTLGITRMGAQHLGHGEIIPPSTTLTFLNKKEVGSSSIIDLIALNKEDGSLTGARDIYMEWLSNAKKDDRVAIKGVGVVSGNTVSTDSELFSLLNPRQMTAQTNTDESRSRNNRWLWVAGIILLLAALLLLAAYFLGLFPCHRSQTTTITEPAVVESVPAPDTLSVAPPPAALASQETLAAGYYVVAGIFRIESNADACVRAAQKNYPGMEVKKSLWPNGMFMVSILRGDTRNDAQKVVNRYFSKSIYSDLWVWEKK